MALTANGGKIAKNNLGFLGVDFQYRLVSAFFERPEFFKDLYSIIDQNMFTDSSLKTIVGIMKDYYARHDTLISYDILLIRLRGKSYSETDIKYFEDVVKKIRGMGTEGIDEIEDLSEKFFKQQNWVRVANEIKRIAGDGDVDKYDECQSLMEEAMAVGRHKEEAYAPLSNIDDDLSKESVVTIPTGVSKLDNALGGGLDKGKIGLIMGPSGFGKTSLTTGISAYAASYKCDANDNMGFKGLQIVFEDSVRDINRKYFSRISQVETRRINESEEITDFVRNAVLNSPESELINENIRVMHLNTGEYSASDIRNIIRKKINEGFKPDFVVVDYFECVEPEKGTGKKDKWEQENKTMRKFENIAKEFNIALWLPTQGNRSSISSELVTLDQGSGSIGKQQIAQVVISITRSVDDIKQQKATIAVLKNRSGAAGIVLNGITFNNGTCTVTCDDIIDFDSVLEYNEYAENKEEELRTNLIDDMRGPHRKYVK